LTDTRRLKRGRLAHCAAVPRPTRTLPAVLLAAAVAALSACGGSDGDQQFGTVTDCTRIGRVTQVADPAGDQRADKAGAAPAPQGDLVALRLARGGGRLCAEFRTKAQIKPYAAFVLLLRPTGAQTPVVQLEATVLSGEKPKALLNPGGGGAAFRRIEAQVGIDGSRLTMLVGRGQFSALDREKIFDALRFQARTAVAGKDDARYTDCLPSCN
jgi:hypothetical protein